jgi:rhamnose transport system substrate-binding protein
MKPRAVSVVVAIVALSAIVVSSSYGSPGKAAATCSKVVMLAKSLNNPYFQITNDGAQKAAKELGIQVQTVGPPQADASAQVSLIDTVAQQKPCALVVSANDPNALVPAMKRAAAKGIHVLTFDSNTASGTELFVNVATQENIGRQQLQVMAKQIGYKGEIAILSGTATSTNQNEWINYMKLEAKKPKYKNMKIVKVAYGNDEERKVTDETNGLLLSYPNLKGIIIPDSVAMPITAQIIQRKGLTGKVKIIGLALPNDMRKYIKSGTAQAALWDVPSLGYLAAYAAHAVGSGKIKAKAGVSFKAGKLGKYTITKDGQVVLGPLLIFTKKNIDKYHF